MKLVQYVARSHYRDGRLLVKRKVEANFTIKPPSGPGKKGGKPVQNKGNSQIAYARALATM
jgi:hypothetical protein